MQIYNGLDRNIIILIVVGLVVSALIMYASNNDIVAPVPISSILKKDNVVSLVDKNSIELDNFVADLSAFAEEDAISVELDVTLVEVGEISEATINLTDDEGSLNNFDSELGSLSEDESINEESDQALQEVSF